MDEEHQHPAGGRGQRSVSCLSSLSFKVCPSPPSGWPRPPPMTSLGSLPKWCPTVHSRLSANKTPASNTHLQARGARWPHGSLISLESGGKREGKKENVNPGGLLENLSYKKAKGWTEESPSGPRETAHPGTLPGPPQAGAPPSWPRGRVTQGHPCGWSPRCPRM